MFDISVIGHITIDRVYTQGKIGAPRMGGSPIYTGLAAAGLGLKPRLCTKVGSDFPDEWLNKLSKSGLDPNQIDRHSRRTTSYELQYLDGRRRLKLISRAGVIEINDLTTECLDAKATVVSPIAGEVSCHLLSLISERARILFIDLQGFIREFDEEGIVSFKRRLEFGRLRSPLTIIKASTVEANAVAGSMDPPSMLKTISMLGCHIAIVTAGASGCYVLYKNIPYSVSAYPGTQVKDLTGAGDVFISGFLSSYLRDHDPLTACKYGNAASSVIVETLGPEEFPSYSLISTRAKSIEISQIKK